VLPLGSEPGTPDPETDMLTTQPLRLIKVTLYTYSPNKLAKNIIIILRVWEIDFQSLVRFKTKCQTHFQNRCGIKVVCAFWVTQVEICSAIENVITYLKQ